jgi:hypothetical protein
VHAYDLGDLGVGLREKDKMREGGLGFQTWVGILGCYIRRHPFPTRGYSRGRILSATVDMVADGYLQYPIRIRLVAIPRE